MTDQKKNIKTGIKEEEKSPIYELIDVSGLANLLSERDWETQTSSISTEDLYEPMITAIPGTKDAKLEKVVRSYWTHVFFSIKQNYEKLILSFKK